MKSITQLFQSILFVLVLFNAQIVIAQPTLEWEANFGGSQNDYGESIIQTTDGGYIVAGSSDSSDGDVEVNKGSTDIWVIKLDLGGNLLWKKNFGGTNKDKASQIIQSSDGGYVVAGSTESSDGDISFNHGQSDYWIFKIDSEGDLIWEKSFGGSKIEIATSIHETTENDFIIAGYSLSIDGDVGGNNGSADYWVIKIDGDGNLLWEQSYGDSNSNRAASILQTKDGGYIIAGSSDEAYDNEFWCWEAIWLIKVDSLGAIEWEVTDCHGDFARVSEIKQTSDDGYILTGMQSGDINESTNCLIIKRDRNGVHQWTKTYNTEYYTGIGGVSIVESKFDDSYSVAAFLATDDQGLEFGILNYSHEGELNWEETFGTQYTELPNSMQQTADGGYVISGTTNKPNSAGGNIAAKDYFVLKLGINTFVTESICQGDSIFLAGAFQTESGTYLDSLSAESVQQTELIVNNTYELFLDDIYACFGDSLIIENETISESGSYVFELLTNAGCDSIVHVNMEFFDEIFVDAETVNDTGSGNGSITLFIVSSENIIEILWSTGDTNVGIIENLTPGEYSVEIIDANGCSVFQTFMIELETSLEDIINQGINIYPNPFTNSITVEIPKEKEIRVDLFNILGQKEAQKILTSENNLIELDHLNTGIYFLNLYDLVKNVNLGSVRLVKE